MFAATVPNSNRGPLIGADSLLSPRPLVGLKMKNPAAPAVKREEEEDWGK